MSSRSQVQRNVALDSEPRSVDLQPAPRVDRPGEGSIPPLDPFAFDPFLYHGFGNAKDPGLVPDR